MRWPFVMLTAVWNNNNISFCRTNKYTRPTTATARAAITTTTETRTQTNIYMVGNWCVEVWLSSLLSMFPACLRKHKSSLDVLVQVFLWPIFCAHMKLPKNGFIISPIEKYIFSPLHTHTERDDATQFIKFLFILFLSDFGAFAINLKHKRRIKLY